MYSTINDLDIQADMPSSKCFFVLFLMGGPYPGRILDRFGVRPANIGPDRVLGLRPG